MRTYGVSWRKLPIAITAVAAVIAISGAVGARQPARPIGVVSAAVEAPYTDVRFEPTAAAVSFWQGKVDEHANDYLSRTSLASTLMLEAKEKGDLSGYAHAEAVIRDALALNPAYDSALLALASARAANHDFTSALQLAQQVNDRAPASVAGRSAAVVIADANFELGNYDIAHAQLHEIAASTPPSLGIESRLAKEAAVEGRNGAAVRLAAQAVVSASELDLRPSDAAFYRFQLAHFLVGAGRLGSAAAVLRAGLTIDPTNIASLELQAKVFVSLGRLQRAAAIYEELLGRTSAPDLRGELAKVYRSLGRRADAAEQIRLGLAEGHQLLGTYPAERRHLAGFFSQFEPVTALAAAQADFATRHDIGAYDTLAWALFVNGRVDDAEGLVATALSRGTRDVTLLYHSGMIERAAGHSGQARHLLAQALRIDPNFDLVEAPRAHAALAALRGNRH